MRVSYDKQADAVYIEITEGKPDGVIEVKEGINIEVHRIFGWQKNELNLRRG